MNRFDMANQNPAGECWNPQLTEEDIAAHKAWLLVVVCEIYPVNHFEGSNHCVTCRAVWRRVEDRMRLFLKVFGDE